MTPLLLLSTLVQADISADLDALLSDAVLARATVGVYVKELGGDALYEKNADKRLIPASVMKLIPTALAFERLGPDYTPVTLAWRDEKGVYLRGGGDPGLTIEELATLAEKMGLKPDDEVHFDDGLFGEERFAPGWEVGDLPFGFSAPISALTVNGGRAELWAEPGNAFLKPRNFGVRVEGKPKAGNGQLRIRRAPNGWTVRVSGSLAKGPARRIAGVSLPDPGLCAARVFHPKAKRALGLKRPKNVFFTEEPISVVTVGPSPMIGTIRARNVEALVRHTLQESDNMYAETLLRLCGAETGDSGSWEDSLKLAVEMLARFEIPEDAYRLSDGSGLSRSNMMTARAVVQLLEQVLMAHNGERFLNSFATPGVGTLEKRLEGVTVWAKTGTLTGVSCIAGVVETHPPVRRFVFAILMNNYAGKAKRPREIQDAIIRRLSQEAAFRPVGAGSVARTAPRY
ncbi:MAG: D-alanyl-D-alanine carboxypeptidase/D-alanyl-D-alanine-endopeptidase [Armatimonadetes bacterium]|nr:D-alanyl-D-alanine carboxypeptidase/D-alanyl-D-alanine-endopeptidase [Armatimonadota bacterium]